MNKLSKIIAVVGPTASGKTSLAIELAQELNGEVISADSRIIYKDFNIGTAKPTQEEMNGILHHLVDVIDPRDDYSASKFKKDASAIIDKIITDGKTPIIAGGTGFYVKSLLEGLDIPEAEPNIEFREEMRILLENKGRFYLHKKLAEIDPITAQKLHPNDSFRVIRALEVHNDFGKPMSELQTRTPPPYDIVYAGLNSADREYLYDRINLRVDLMIEAGLVDEVQNLINKYGKTLSLLKTLGYKEISEQLDGLYSLEESVELIKKNTRNFAKRQLTWFRANPEINWFYIDQMSGNEIKQAVIKIYNEQI